ncbi:MAG: stage II sporulation protein D [Clostridia bacterium]|nr:stage II sporulation protein D [Clostridia bacterium]
MRKWMYGSWAVISLLTLFFLYRPFDGQENSRALLSVAPALFSKESPSEENFENVYLMVFETSEGEMRRMEIEEYVAGVVLSEMPASFDYEALKAQAVAARTYAVFKSSLHSGEGCFRHEGADVCTSSACCQGYTDASSFSDRSRAAQAINAATETAGEIAVYRGRPIRAMYHASAGGHTENAENVYSEALAYLRGVESPGEENYPQFSAESIYTLTELENAFSGNDDILLTDKIPLSDQLEILSRSDTGRVLSIRVGLTALSGNDFRRYLDLKSANFDMEFVNASVRFVTTGFGHGVGMSQTGADWMAKSGKSYADILKWYYTGIEIENLIDFIGRTQNSTEI